MGQNILATLAYYDVLDIPLTAEEIYRYLIKLESAEWQTEKSSPYEIKAVLNQLLTEGKVFFADGFYFLNNRQHLVPLRKRRQQITAGKWRKARRAVYFMKFLPYVKAVFASGSLALNNSEELGDLDVLIVLKRGRIWLGRVLVSGLMSLLGVRRKYFEKIAPDKICLNHYITDKSLTIPFKSVYNAQTYLNLVPILLRDEKILEQFCRANSWLDDFIFLDSPVWLEARKGRTLKFGLFAKAASTAIEWLMDKTIAGWLEKAAKNYQVRRIERNPLTRNPNGHVVYDDSQLAFHPDSPEQKILARYRENLNKSHL